MWSRSATIVNAASAIIVTTASTMSKAHPAIALSWLCHVTNPNATNSRPSTMRMTPSTVNGHSSRVKSTDEKSRSRTARLISAMP